MQEVRYKVLMYIFLSLFILSAGVGGYFSYKYIKLIDIVTKIQGNNLFSQDEINQANEEIIQNSIFGNIKNINLSTIDIVTTEGEEKTLNFDNNLVVEKLIQTQDNPTQYLYEKSELSQLVIGNGVWVVLDKNDKNKANIVKINEIK